MMVFFERYAHMFLTAVEAARVCEDEAALITLVSEHNLAREHLSSVHHAWVGRRSERQCCIFCPDSCSSLCFMTSAHGAGMHLLLFFAVLHAFDIANHSSMHLFNAALATECPIGVMLRQEQLRSTSLQSPRPHQRPPHICLFDFTVSDSNL
jgi:hypothetical protein